MFKLAFEEVARANIVEPQWHINRNFARRPAPYHPWPSMHRKLANLPCVPRKEATSWQQTAVDIAGGPLATINYGIVTR